MSVDVITFGCRLNAYESEAIKVRAREAQLRDTVVVNTCAVTAEAVRQSRQAIRKLKRERPGTRIIVTGCAAQTEPQTYAAMAEVDAVIGNSEKLTTQAYCDFGIGQAEKVRVNDIMAVRETASQMADCFGSDLFEGRTRAFLQVQNGCDHRCTFCIIPFGRGNSRSVPMGAVVEEARRLVEKGFAEIVLTGVDLTAYGADLPSVGKNGPPTLGQLIEKLLKLVPALKRLRLSSLDSIEADAVLMRMIADQERLMPHFHLSAQSGDDMILKRMKRRHTRADTITFCETVRHLRPEAAFGADLIAGFPTETEAMFENSLRLVADAGLSSLHVFPFSPRAGTPAARMPQLSRAEVKDRAARLRARGTAALAARHEAMRGSRQTILVEKSGFGRTECFAAVEFAGNALPGSFVSVDVSGRRDDHLLGEICG
jgi:threonylcarbamoyladenosine tRNA methylthiotransferase MtaB